MVYVSRSQVDLFEYESESDCVSCAALSPASDKVSAFGLKQPALERTHLCELPDSALDRDYVIQREQFREHVLSLTQPKIMQGQAMDGTAFAEFLEKSLEGPVRPWLMPLDAVCLRDF